MFAAESKATVLSRDSRKALSPLRSRGVPFLFLLAGGVTEGTNFGFGLFGMFLAELSVRWHFDRIFGTMLTALSVHNPPPLASLSLPAQSLAPNLIAFSQAEPMSHRHKHSRLS
jgi:hypothetical protein